MNTFLTSTTLLSICLLTSCATIQSYRPGSNSPSKKKKTQQAEKISKPVEPLKPRPVYHVKPTEKITSPRNKVINTPTEKGRTVPDMLEPSNITRLPDNKDLQESNVNTPAPAQLTPKLQIPVVPLPEDPLSPLPSHP